MKFALFTLDIEQDFGANDYSIELFTNQALFQKFSDMMNSRDIPLNGFIVTEMLLENIRLIHKIQHALPVEFGTHSHRHPISSRLSQEDLTTSINTFEKYLGYSPMGYRAPCGLIDSQGIKTLIKYGFVYDTSIFPSIRPDEYGYNHISLPQTPFLYKGANGTLLEFPIGCIQTIRLVTSVSYLKLFGLKAYMPLMKIFGLPEILIINCHPYDFTINACLDSIPGYKKWLHKRNASNAFKFTEKLLDYLLELDYTFTSYSAIVDHIMNRNLPVVRI